MAPDRTSGTIRAAAALLTLMLAITLAACGSGGSGGDPGAGNPDSKLTAKQAKQPLPKGAPSQLIEMRKQANTLIEADAGDALQTRLDELKAAGIPVVINKWASWCGPCREEFPDFQDAAVKYQGKIAFIGLNSNDGPDTARTFLSEFPVPYPSYSDPNQDIAGQIKALGGFPQTLFIDSSGETAFTKLGPFASAADLNRDIAQYALQ